MWGFKGDTIEFCMFFKKGCFLLKIYVAQSFYLGINIYCFYCERKETNAELPNEFCHKQVK